VKRLYLDTNVVMDYLLKREPFDLLAKQLIAAAADGRAQVLVSSLTFTTAHYLARKTLGNAGAVEALTTLFQKVEVTNVCGSEIDQALQSGRPDFEDAVQFYAALAAGTEALVTRDPEGFPASPVPVLNPLTALAQL